jgi:sulfopyruvate decarboxylase subunit alpha
VDAPAPKLAVHAGVEHAVAENGPLSAGDVLAALEREGVTHVTGIPDNDTAALFDQLVDHPRLRLVRVAREGECFGLAAGLWMGGKTAAVVIQNTGLLESGDAIRGTASRMGVPLVVIVGYRGFKKMEAAGWDPVTSAFANAEATRSGAAAGESPLSAETLVRQDLDGVALMTEPTLRAWGIPYERIASAEDLPRIGLAFARARGEQRVVALLLCSSLIQ